MSSSLAGPSSTGSMLSGGGISGNKIPKGYRQGQTQNFTPEMMGLFKQLFSNVSPDSYTSRLASGDEDMFNEIEAPAMKQFSELQGGLASRFSGMGMGARKSSGFQNASNQATQDFAGQLQSQRQGLQRQALQDLMGFSSSLLGQKPYEQFLAPKQQKKKGFWGSILGKLGGSVPGALAGYAEDGWKGAGEGAAAGFSNIPMMFGG